MEFDVAKIEDFVRILRNVEKNHVDTAILRNQKNGVEIKCPVKSKKMGVTLWHKV